MEVSIGSESRPAMMEGQSEEGIGGRVLESVFAISSAMDASPVRKRNAGARINRCAGERMNYVWGAGSS